VQTIRPGQVGPVGILLGGDKLTGCFLKYQFIFHFPYEPGKHIKIPQSF
jgi:hypothetical protein